VTELWTLTDLGTPWCVHVVVTLRVAEHLAAGTTRIDELAAAAGCDAAALSRVLRHLVDKGLFAQPAPDRFALNDAARQLLDPGTRLGLDLDGIGGRMAYAWGSLLSAVRTGRPAYHEVFGREFWDDLQAHPDVAASFDALMGPAGHGTPDPHVLADGDWPQVRHVVDVGGGTGALLAEVLRTRPDLRGTLVDQPRVVARAGETFAAAGVADRASTVGQSFFDPLPAGADLYLLKSVLSDWPDQQARDILRRCAEAARPHGRVVVLNGVSPDDPAGPPPELLMLVLVGGAQRTLTQVRALAGEAGLDVRTAGPRGSWRYVVECRPTRDGSPGTA
jgi:2,7-dihydroxy-5-methyl-1-naphthoate 7-O-methyltransferase